MIVKITPPPLILDLISVVNYDLIKDKFYAGSSDATILLCALNKKTNIKCFHSLMITNGFVENSDYGFISLGSEAYYASYSASGTINNINSIKGYNS